VVIGDWKHDYNHHRRHSSLGYQPPARYAATCTHQRTTLVRRQFLGSGQYPVELRERAVLNAEDQPPAEIAKKSPDIARRFISPLRRCKGQGRSDNRGKRSSVRR
jgi:Integrase core domain